MVAAASSVVVAANSVVAAASSFVAASSSEVATATTVVPAYTTMVAAASLWWQYLAPEGYLYHLQAGGWSLVAKPPTGRNPKVTEQVTKH